jgi:hypothetical protein
LSLQGSVFSTTARPEPVKGLSCIEAERRERREPSNVDPPRDKASGVVKTIQSERETQSYPAYFADAIVPWLGTGERSARKRGSGSGWTPIACFQGMSVHQPQLPSPPVRPRPTPSGARCATPKSRRDAAVSAPRFPCVQSIVWAWCALLSFVRPSTLIIETH